VELFLSGARPGLPEKKSKSKIKEKK